MLKYKKCRSTLWRGGIAVIRHMHIGMALLFLILSGCASLPDYAALHRIDAPQQHPQVLGQNGLLSRSQSDAILRRLQKQGSGNLLERHLAFMETLNANPLVTGNGVRLLIDGPATYQAMFNAIESARDHINLETYILEEDEVGQKFAALLLQKQSQGVQVNLIYDSVGALSTSADFFEKLRQQGINICEFNPVNPLKGKIFALNNRDHRKLLIVDGKIGFAGGINISRVYSSGIFRKRNIAGADGSWRDTHVEVRGPAVKDLQQLFIDTWKKQPCGALENKAYFPVLSRQGDTVVRTIGSSPDISLNMIYIELLSAISHAEKSIAITMAYFVPDQQLIDAIKQAVQRGVDVKLLLPGFSDYWITFHAGRSYYEELLRAGVKIYERRDALLHAKTAVIDDVWSTVGSSNMDLRSFLHNDEINVIVLSSDFAQQMKSMFDADLEMATPIDLTSWNNRSPSKRVKEGLARLWAYWL
jgi:cardiolipin synthase